ncbi:MAG: condensation domain-containing protein, partial [Actinomycetota bacterium]
TQVMSRVREAFGVELPLRVLFEAPTVRELAGRVEQEKRSGEEPGPIRRRAEGAVVPLSYAQQRLWFLEQLHPGTSLYHVPMAVRLSGELDVEALQASVNEIVRRHEVLRTSFALVEGRPVQVVHDRSTVSIPLVDLSDAGPNSVEAIMDGETTHPFDLTQLPLFRLRLIRLSVHEHVLMLVMHHMVTDGWSMGVFRKEIAAFYSAMIEKKAPTVAPLEIQYGDYSIWQREWLDQGALDRQLAYWKQQLKGPLPALDIACDFHRPTLQSFAGKQYFFSLPSTLKNEIHTLSRRQGTTPFMIFLAAFTTMLHHYSGQRDIVVGTAVANRNHSQTEDLIGFFVNLLALRTDLSGNPALTEILKRVRKTTLDAYDHQDVPFEKVVDEVQPLRDLSRAPLFQTLLVLQNTKNVTAELPGLALQTIDLNYRTAKFDLCLYLTENETDISGWLEYNCDLFGVDRMETMCRDFQALLESIVRDPEQSLADTRSSITDRQMHGPYRTGLHIPRKEQGLVTECETLPNSLAQDTESAGAAEKKRVFVGPRTPTEKAVSQAWARVLDVQEISINDKFFEIGGDSLRIVHLFLELSITYPGKLTVADLFTHNTIGSLSSHIDAIGNSSAEEPSLQAYEL